MLKWTINTVIYSILALGIIFVPISLARYTLSSARSVAVVPDGPNYLSHTAPQSLPHEKLLSLLNKDMRVIQSVPRQFLTRLPVNLTTTTDTNIKKRMFASSVLPAILRANELIIADRTKVFSLRDKIAHKQRLRASERTWLGHMLKTYRIKYDESHDRLTVQMLDDLLYKVDIVPPSLGMAQAAIETGWGTSYFAQEGNALFGEWAWGDTAGLLPRGREAGKTHKIKKFEYLLDSVRSYMLNLNRHTAYRELRARRAELRSHSLAVTGPSLAPALIEYSERGEAYVTSILSIINYNGFDGLDNAQLAKS